MSENKINYRLKGHGSFYIREGWLRKGIKNIHKNSSILGEANATDVLGVGANMVKAIRYWLQVCGLTTEQRIKGGSGKREQILTEDIGQIINKYDPYFEDIFSLWLLHYKMSSNFELCTSWHIFFNDFNVNTFSKIDMQESLKQSLIRITKHDDFSFKSLNDDCICILKTYLPDENAGRSPEENIISPFSELGLLGKIKNNSGVEIFIKNKPSMEKLDKLIVYYIILDNMAEGKDNTTIDNLLYDDCNVGKILNFDRNILNIYLDKLRYSGLISINRAAGLDTIYLKELNKIKILEDYYK